MRKQIVIKLLSLTVIMYLGLMDVAAQCAMCRASVENNVSEGESISLAAKLNLGIMYLFAMPYIIAAVIGYVWYKKAKKNRALKAS